MAIEPQSNGEALEYRTQIAQMNAESNSKELHGNQWIGQSGPSLMPGTSPPRRDHATKRQDAKNSCAEPNLRLSAQPASQYDFSESLCLCGSVVL
jgi:hypothetical protein